MKRWWAFLPVLAILALVGLFGISSLQKDPRLRDSPLLGQTLPPLMTPSPAGPEVNLAQASGPYLLNVWASWCAPCRVEHPTLMQIQKDGLAIHGLLYKDTWSQADRLLKTEGNPFRLVGLDPKGEVALSLGVSGAPETFVVDRHGIVRFHIVGIIDEDLYRQRILPALQN